MKRDLQFLRRLRRWSLKLFPKKYQEEFGEELQEIFDLAIEDAVIKGGFEIEKLILRELVDLPGAVILEHLRERRRATMAGKFASRFDFIPGSSNETWAALAPFLLFGALPTLLGYFRVSDMVPVWVDILFVIVLWSFGLGLLVIGFIKRFPRWFMPYIGVPLPFFSLMLFNSSLTDGLWGVWWYRLPWFLSEFLQQGLLWMGMIFLVVLLLVSTRFIPASHPFHQRLRDDWTLLSFILYGSTPLMLVITLSDYKNEELYMFLALLILAAGGWLYLQNDEPLKKFIYLNLGVGLSMIVAATAKAVLVRSSFPNVLADEWLFEFMSTCITWMWLALIMLIPALPRLLTPMEESSERI